MTLFLAFLLAAPAHADGADLPWCCEKLETLETAIASWLDTPASPKKLERLLKTHGDLSQDHDDIHAKLASR